MPRAPESHETRKTNFDFDYTSYYSHQGLLSLFSCTRPLRSISSEIWNSLFQNTPLEEFSFIMTTCSISEYCLLTLDHHTLFMGSKIKLSNLNIQGVQRNLIIFPSLTNQCFFLSFFFLMKFFFAIFCRVESWKYNSIIKENDCRKDWCNLKRQVNAFPYQILHRVGKSIFCLPRGVWKELMDNGTNEKQNETTVPNPCLFAKWAKKDFWLIKRD